MRAFEAGEHDGSAALDHFQGVGDGLRGVGGDIEHDIDAAPAGGFEHALDCRFGVDVDGQVRAELAGEREFVFVAAQAGDDNLPRAGGARGDDGAESALAGAEDCDALADLKLRRRDGPVEARAERVIERGQARRQIVGHFVHCGRRGEIHVLGVTAPERRRAVGSGVAVAGGAVDAAFAGAAAVANAAADAGFDNNQVAHLNAPALAGAVAQRGDSADRFVARNYRIARSELAVELLVIGAADTADFHPQQPVVVADFGQGERLQLQFAHAGLDHRAGGRRQRLGHRSTPFSAPLSVGRSAVAYARCARRRFPCGAAVPD